MTLLIIVAAIAVIFLANAWRLDRRAAGQGLKYVPVKQKGWVRSRTRMVLVEKESADEVLVEKLYEEQLELRRSRADYDPYRFLPGRKRPPKD